MTTRREAKDRRIHRTLHEFYPDVAECPLCRAQILNGYLAGELARERNTDPADELDAARAALREV